MTIGGKYVAEQNIKIDGAWKVRRKTFETEAGAVEHLQESGESKEKHGTSLLTLKQWELADFQESLAMLKREGLEHVKLVETVKYYIERNKISLEQWTVAEAVQARLADMKRRNLRPDSITGTTKILNRFQKSFGKKRVRGLTQGQIEGWIINQNGSERTKENIRNEISVLLNFCEKKLNDFRNDACKPIPKSEAEIKDAKHAEIMTPAQVQKFMELVETKHLRHAPAFALMFFAGIRPKELTKTDNALTWEDIHLDEPNEIGGKGVIYIKSKTAKIRKGRKIPIMPNLFEWLNLCEEKTGKIGLAYSSTSEVRRAGMKNAKIKDWVQDYPRHSFGTNAGELYSLHKSAQWMGHVGGIKVFVEHYQGLSTQAQAQAYFEILPKAKREEKGFNELIKQGEEKEIKNIQFDESGVSWETKKES